MQSASAASMSENPKCLKQELDRALTVAPCVIVLVGLPARGKTYMARKLTRYLNWVGITTKVFNVGQYRRVAAPESIKNGSEFFRDDNAQARELREKCAVAALDDLNRWLRNGCGEVAVYDATNSVRSRRQMICDYVSKCGYKLFFVESICSDPKVIEANIRLDTKLLLVPGRASSIKKAIIKPEVKLSSPDYVNIDADRAIEDFRQRIKNYELQYEPLDVEHDRDLSFIQIFDQGAKYLVNGVRGHIESRCVYYLMNIHVLPRTIYLTRHGETKQNVEGRIGADSELTERGRQFSEALAKFAAQQNQEIPLKVWTGLHKESIATAANIKAEHRESWKTLNEIDCGVCEGLTYDEIQASFPEELELRDVDKYYYRYPSGESYQDLVTRLEPVIMELERSENVLVVCHQAVMRCLLAYFVDKSIEDLPYLEVPLHTVLKLTPVAYGCKIEQITFGIGAVSTHRPRPNVPKLSEEEIRTRRRRSSGAKMEPLIRKLAASRQAEGATCGSAAEPIVSASGESIVQNVK